MEKQLIFGTFDVPVLTNETLTATYSAPGILSKEALEKVSFSESTSSDNQLNDFDQQLKGILSVPKPKK